MTISKFIVGAGVAVLVGCSVESATQKNGGAQGSVSAAEMAALFKPEPGSSASDYAAEDRHYRVMGTQGAGSDAFVTLMDTQTHRTLNIPANGLVARNLQIHALGDTGVDVARSAGPTLHGNIGDELVLRSVQHRYDGLRTSLGKHQAVIDAKLLAEVSGKYGAGATGVLQTVFPDPGVQLVNVDPEGILARLGFQEGDIVFHVNGLNVSKESPAMLAQRLTHPISSKVVLDVYRGTSLEVWTLMYQ